ncbi:MAG: carboxylating nicotinate-nucleotide diphosphorylase [Phycisphaerales bacterium]|nr:carboxylating nicotinate-nucleotide diphosphorylase [Phycisphaerales bacterium]
MAGSAASPTVDLAALAPDALLDALLPAPARAALVARVLAEDLGEAGDVTSEAMIDAQAHARAVLRPRTAGIACGMRLAAEVLAQAAPGAHCSAHVRDGERVDRGAAMLSVEGPLRGILAAERTMLNFVGRMSGIATRTAEFVAAVAGTRATVLDTRKTTPGLRALEKHAVRCGGGANHRIGLFDAMLVKDNHVAGLAPAAMAARVADAARRARARHALAFVEAECDDLEQFRAIVALPAGTVDIALLDNMGLDALRACVALRDASAPALKLEASGGVRLETVRAIAETGIDRISVGALTHSAPCLDVGLDIEAA